jgi:hypothetical protein
MLLSWAAKIKGVHPGALIPSNLTKLSGNVSYVYQAHPRLQEKEKKIRKKPGSPRGWVFPENDSPVTARKPTRTASEPGSPRPGCHRKVTRLLPILPQSVLFGPDRLGPPRLHPVRTYAQVSCLLHAAPETNVRGGLVCSVRLRQWGRQSRCVNRH